MDALLGKITQIDRKDTGGSAATLEVRFKPAGVLPQRAPAPEWLKDQVLKLERAVPDPREVGDPGDSVVLTPEESLRWLAPLTVTPNVVYGKLPATLQLHLRWWKEEKLPEWTVRSNGRSLSGEFTKESEGGTATVDTTSFFPFEPRLPVTFEVTCDKMQAACTVLPTAEPCSGKLVLPEGEQHRLENDWYALSLVARCQGGGVESLWEKGRGIDHFRDPVNRIHHACEHGGHIDRYSTEGWDWSDKLRETRMSCVGERREEEALRLDLEGVVDDGQGLRTSLGVTLYDRLPLLLLERRFQFHKKEPEKKDGKDEKPREPIDDMKPLQLGFQGAWIAERSGAGGSRILCMDGDRFVVTRPGLVGETVWQSYWRMSDGWIVVEHPRRREYTLYLFDPRRRPYLGAWLSEQTLSLAPFWPHQPIRPDQSAGLTLGLTAGEICGAGVEGAWVACRAPRSGGGMRSGLIARLRDSVAAPTADFSLGGEVVRAPLERTLIPGLGRVHFAAAEFPQGQIDQPFDVTLDPVVRRQSP
jgi:hypothetical protein